MQVCDSFTHGLDSYLSNYMYKGERDTKSFVYFYNINILEKSSIVISVFRQTYIFQYYYIVFQLYSGRELDILHRGVGREKGEGQGEREDRLGLPFKVMFVYVHVVITTRIHLHVHVHVKTLTGFFRN